MAIVSDCVAKFLTAKVYISFSLTVISLQLPTLNFELYNYTYLVPARQKETKYRTMYTIWMFFLAPQFHFFQMPFWFPQHP